MGANFALWLAIAVRVNDIKLARSKGPDEPWKKPIVANVNVAFEAVYANAVDHFLACHRQTRRSTMIPIRSKYMNFMAPIDQLFCNVLADNLGTSNNRRIIWYKLSNF